jgi:hypothetical protein
LAWEKREYSLAEDDKKGHQTENSRTKTVSLLSGCNTQQLIELELKLEANMVMKLVRSNWFPVNLFTGNSSTNIIIL